MGYHIPSGAMIIPNVVSMHMNPSIFDDPETFNPQRYIDDPSLPGHVFGFGRRACPGRAVAEETIFMVLAMVVWGLNVRKEKDESGMEKEIDTDRGSAFAPGGVMKPYGFHVSINSRSVERAKLLAAVVEAEGL
jgi:hypothetical protein